MIKAGLYIHIPFCAVKCMYCDFYSIADRDNEIPDFIGAIVKEIEMYEVDSEELIFDTIFIGGGTPSIIKPKYIEEILNSLNQKFNLSKVEEFTLEANPGEAPKDRLKDFLSLGFNRLSIGVQSLQPELLKFLTRIHSANQVFETFDHARSVGFKNINCDLIYSIPGQTWDMWEKDLRRIIDLEPNHISAYTLTVENGTQLSELVRKNKIKMPSDDKTGDWFLNTHSILKENGYPAYEISNFSRLGMECKHNLHYWRIEPYLAFGPSAHGFDGNKRWNNVKSLNSYIQKVNSGKQPISKSEILSKLESINEALGFGLRMVEGFDIRLIPDNLSRSFEEKYLTAIIKFPGLISKKGFIISLTIDGMLLSDQIIPELILVEKNVLD